MRLRRGTARRAPRCRAGSRVDRFARLPRWSGAKSRVFGTPSGQEPSMSLQHPKTQAEYQRALKVMPYGVNSNFRYWGPQDTVGVSRGQGAYLWDVDGKRYIDYRMGFGPVMLGHGYPAVADRVAQTIRETGTVFAFTTVMEIELAERLTRMTGMDQVRLANSGTEATMHALRLAR